MTEIDRKLFGGSPNTQLTMPNKTIVTATLFTLLFAAPVFAQMRPLRVENVARIKGQESTVIQGWGIVSGLSGTGDDPKAYTPAARAILRDLDRTGMFGSDEKGIQGARNSALVRVTATIPGTGAKSGDMIDCTVAAAGNAKSLANGILFPAILGSALRMDENSLVQGIAHGNVAIEQAATPTRGRITGGAQLRADFDHPYIKDGLVTLVVRPEYARPSMLLEIAKAINEDPEIARKADRPARAINSNYVVVRMPAPEYENPMDFVAKILNAEIMDPPVAVPRVTINERARTIAIDENVEVRPTIVTHPNFVVDVEPELGPGEMEQFPRQFLDLDTDMKFRQMSGEAVTNMKLRALKATMDSLRATPEDVIDVIKILQKQGAIIGDVVFVD